MRDIILDQNIQSSCGAQEFGRIDSGYGNLTEPQLIQCSLMKMMGPDGRWNGKIGVAKQGGRYVAELPNGYDWNVGIMPQDGKLLVTRPGMPTLLADCETGIVRKL